MSQQTSNGGQKTETLKGSVKEAIGKLIGDGKIEAEGKAEQTDPAAQKSSKSNVKPKTTKP